MKKKAFTLAEVLITICILGIVAAITLPAINANINNTVLEKQTLKFYTQAQKAFDLYKANNEVDKITGMGLEDNIDGFVKEYFNIAEKCSKAEDCFAKEYGSIEGKSRTKLSNILIYEDNIYKLKDGTVFTIYTGDETHSGTIRFDVNGKKGPNVAGRDLWDFSVFYDGSIDESGMTPDYKLNSTPEKIKKDIKLKFYSCKNGTYGGCFGHFMRNGFKFDY